MQGISQALCKIFCFLLYGIFLQTNTLCAYSTVPNDYSLCRSKECIRHANMIIKNMNPEVDPCRDFYSFACGGYKTKFGVNETRSVYDDTWYLLQTQIKDLVKNLKPEEGSSSEKLKTVFENCMDIESSENNSVSDAVDFLSHVGIPNWPKLDEDFRFVERSRTLGKLAAYGEFAFVSFKPSPYKAKLMDSNQQIPALILQGNFLLNSKMIPKDVHNSVLRILNYFNIDKNETENIWKDFMEIENSGIRLQNEMANPSDCKSTPRAIFREINCSEDTIGSMKFLCDFWTSAVETEGLNKYYSTNIIHISCSWSHFHYINNIFSYLDKLSDRSLAKYLSLRFFISHLDDLNSYFHLTKRTFPGDKRSRTSEPISRWEYCVGWIIKSMNSALGYEYTRSILTENVENSVLDIIKHYVQELHNSVKNLNWLGERIKLYLQKQLMNLDIGFKKTMAKYRNKTSVQKLYKEFNPTKGSFLKNILEYQKTSLTTKEKSLFNSFYSSSDPYTMDFGMALLQPPTFSYGLPKMWNYAGLGFAVGHELSHNFNFFFDFVHLDEATEDYLNSKFQCFIEQYSQFIIKKTGKMTNYAETKEEIIADNLGWTLTEKIIKEMMHDNSSELLKLPGLNYSPLQLTYISFAQDSCAVLSKEVEAEFYASKPQNLANHRVNGVLQNSKTFSDAFNCAKEDAMNPENKCTFFS